MTIRHRNDPRCHADARPRAAARKASHLLWQVLLAWASAILLLPALTGCETSPAGPGATGGVSGGSAAQAHGRLIEAFNGCNEAGFVAAYAPLFSLVTSNTKQAVTTREGLQRYLATGCGTRPNPTAALVQQTTRVSGAITVLAGQYRFRVPTSSTPVPGAAPAPVQMVEVLQNFTLVLERMGDRWLVLAHHVSVAP